jgi:hypothetical protein
MPYTNPRGLGVSDVGDILRVTLACTLADYTSGGTQEPQVGDIVVYSPTGNWFGKRAGAGASSKLCRVTSILKRPVGTDQGFYAAEPLDTIRFVELNASNLANVSLGNVAKKVGPDTTANDWDAQSATGGNLLVVARSAAAGAGTFVAAVLVRDL